MSDTSFRKSGVRPALEPLEPRLLLSAGGGLLKSTCLPGMPTRPAAVAADAAAGTGITGGRVYYVDASRPGDSGSGTSWATAKKYISSGVGLLSGGDTLLIADGVYTGSLNRIRHVPSGSAGSYTTIQAANDWGVTISEPNGYPCRIDDNSYVEVRGIHFEDYNSVRVYVSDSDHIKVIRVSSDGNDPGSHAPAVLITNTRYALVEESFSYGSGRYPFQTSKGNGNSEYIIFRRCVVRWDYSNDDEPQACFANYDCDYVTYQNCIALDAKDIKGTPHTYDGVKGFFTPNGSEHTSWEGCIALNLEGAGWFLEGSRVVDASLTDCISWDLIDQPNEGYGAYPLYFAADADGGPMAVDHVTVGVADYGRGVQFRQPLPNDSITNSVIYGIRLDSGQYAVHGAPISQSDYNCYYNNTGGRNASAGVGSHSLTGTDPLTSSLLYLPRIEDASSLAGRADDGGDVGATILKQWGFSGTLWGEPGWDTLTDESLWPFPNEDVMKEKMAAFHKAPGAAFPDSPEMIGARGFCAEGTGLYGGPITLTSYIWEYLGNEMPAWIYDTTPPAVEEVQVNGQADRSVSAVASSSGGIISIVVRFSEPVRFVPEDVLLRKVTFPGGVEKPGEAVTPGSITGSGTDTMVITLPAGAAADTWVKVTLSDSLTDLAGNALDGDAPASGSGRGYLYDPLLDLPSGDGTAGGDAVFYVGSQIGDCSGDGSVNIFDAFAFNQAWGSQAGEANYDPKADFTGDGSVNIFDAFQLNSHWGHTLDALPAAGIAGADVAPSQAGDAIELGALTATPTFECVGLKVAVQGDLDNDSTTIVQYRRSGTQEWLDAMGLYHQVPQEVDYENNTIGGIDVRYWGGSGGLEAWPANQLAELAAYEENYLAGSVFHLAPGAAYEFRVIVSDPDGGGGTRTVNCTTRTFPVIPADGNEIEVSGGGSALAAALAGASAGDVFLVHAGTYSAVTISAGGTAEEPICVKPYGDGEVRLEGYASDGIRIYGDYVYVEGLRINNFNEAFDIQEGADNVAVMKCHMTGCWTSIRARGNNGYFADNIIVGVWTGGSEGHGLHIENIHTEITGNVVAYNLVRQVADGTRLYHSTANSDLYGNDFLNLGDDGVELDYSHENQRVWGNRFSHTGANGISFQPHHLGPAYVIGNVVANVDENTIKDRYESRGLVLVNNTMVTDYKNDLIQCTTGRNNLFLSTGYYVAMEYHAEDFLRDPVTLDLDYNGYNGRLVADHWSWWDKFFPETEEHDAKTLAQWQALTGQESHGVYLAYDDTFAEPWPSVYNYHPDFRLKPGSPAIDAGIALPNVSDSYTGSAPDLGALEYGAPLPQWGPRQVYVYTETLPNAAAGAAYTAALEHTGSAAPYAWSVSSGNLPAGLSIDPATGVISGTPVSGGVFSFTVELRDGLGDTHRRPLAVTISDAVPPHVVAVEANGRQDRGVSSTVSDASGVTTVTVTFDEPVVFAAGDVAVRTVAFPGGTEVLGATLTPESVTGSGTDTMTIAFAGGSAVDTWIKVTLNGTGPIADLSGNVLDGDAPASGSGRGYLYDASDLPSGDGAEGGNAAFHVGSQVGDCSGDGRVNIFDAFRFNQAWGRSQGEPGYDANADFSGDGSVNIFDAFSLNSHWGDELDPLPAAN